MHCAVLRIAVADAQSGRFRPRGALGGARGGFLEGCLKAFYRGMHDQAEHEAPVGTGSIPSTSSCAREGASDGSELLQPTAMSINGRRIETPQSDASRSVAPILDVRRSNMREDCIGTPEVSSIHRIWRIFCGPFPHFQLHERLHVDRPSQGLDVCLKGSNLFDQSVFPPVNQAAGTSRLSPRGTNEQMAWVHLR